MFLKPMFASPLPKDFTLEPDEFSAEEKFDGHRLIVEVANGSTSLFVKKGITAWSRYGLERQLPTHLLEALDKMPNGIYDGELLVPGKRSYGVTELVNGPDLNYFVFDILQCEDTDLTPVTYDLRQGVLQEIFRHVSGPVVHAPTTEVNTWEQVIALRDSVWSRDGEGLILKRRSAPYQIGKRSKDFIKIKALRSAVLTVIGFVPSKGLINNRGDYATVMLQDDDGNITTVKTRNDAACRQFEREAVMGERHPAIGRRLCIEYQERTPDGNYRHPRWDRWEDG